MYTLENSSERNKNAPYLFFPLTNTPLVSISLEIQTPMTKLKAL